MEDGDIMKQAFIQNLDKNLKCVEYKIKKEKFILIAESIETDVNLYIAN